LRQSVDRALDGQSYPIRTVDVLGVLDATVTRVVSSAPLGAAAIARLAVSPDLSLADAIVDWSPSLSFEPQWSPDRTAEFSTRWRTVADLSL